MIKLQVTLRVSKPLVSKPVHGYVYAPEDYNLDDMQQAIQQQLNKTRPQTDPVWNVRIIKTGHLVGVRAAALPDRVNYWFGLDLDMTFVT